jgi:Xaa-Pro aminopeptidase
MDRLHAGLAGRGLSALVCARNLNVLLVSGFWPVIGTAVAIVTPEPRVLLVVPEEAAELADAGWADLVCTYPSGSLERIEALPTCLLGALGSLLKPLVGHGGTVGVETASAHLPASYCSQHVYGDSLRTWLGESFPQSAQQGADELLARLRMRPTTWERERIRVSCELAAVAYWEGVARLNAGVSELEAVQPFRAAFAQHAAARSDIARADSWFYCMSGANAAHAWAAFQQSRHTRLHSGVPVLVHCNSVADGYWTDLTRTYVLGEPDERLAAIFTAVSHARDAALNVIRPGVAAATVDRAAREVLAEHGYGEQFVHPLGHGVGFAAIDHNEPPRLHPASHEVLEEGMVFNVEPGVYLDGIGGVRDCNMVAVSSDGCELLSPWHQQPQDWSILT